MVRSLSKDEGITVLASAADWAWPVAVRDIFSPRGVSLLVARDASEFVSIIEQRRVHTTIVDIDSEEANGFATIKIIRMDYPLLPCIILTGSVGRSVLSRALELEVFSVIDKPVDMGVLLRQLNTLFIKRYDSHVFG